MVKSFNHNVVDFTKEYMFLGEQPNVSRFDVSRHPIFVELYKKQLGFFWKPEEVDLTKDTRDFKLLQKNEQHVFISNLASQTFLDSVQTRSPLLALLPHVSLPELESFISLWSMMESLHSFSYSYIIRNVFSNPTEILDGIMSNKTILERSDKVTKYYDELMEYSEIYRTFSPHVEDGTTIKVGDNSVVISKMLLKKKILLAVASVNVLEGVRFYASFACSFSFAERSLMEGNAKVLKLILRDENLHLAATQNILNKWRLGHDDPDMQALFNECKEQITEMYRNCVAEEQDWSRYLFSMGPLMGLNEHMLNNFVEYIAGQRMKAIGLSHEYTKTNPLGWMTRYMDSDATQVAPQETEIDSYVIGGVKNDVLDADFDDLGL